MSADSEVWERLLKRGNNEEHVAEGRKVLFSLFHSAICLPSTVVLVYLTKLVADLTAEGNAAFELDVIEVDEAPDLTADCRITTIPTLFVFGAKSAVLRVDSSEIRRKVPPFLAGLFASPSFKFNKDITTLLNTFPNPKNQVKLTPRTTKENASAKAIPWGSSTDEIVKLVAQMNKSTTFGPAQLKTLTEYCASKKPSPQPLFWASTNPWFLSIWKEAQARKETTLVDWLVANLNTFAAIGPINAAGWGCLANLCADGAFHEHIRLKWPIILDAIRNRPQSIFGKANFNFAFVIQNIYTFMPTVGNDLVTPLSRVLAGETPKASSAGWMAILSKILFRIIHTAVRNIHATPFPFTSHAGLCELVRQSGSEFSTKIVHLLTQHELSSPFITAITPIDFTSLWQFPMELSKIILHDIAVDALVLQRLGMLNKESAKFIGESANFWKAMSRSLSYSTKSTNPRDTPKQAFKKHSLAIENLRHGRIWAEVRVSRENYGWMAAPCIFVAGNRALVCVTEERARGSFSTTSVSVCTWMELNDRDHRFQLPCNYTFAAGNEMHCIGTRFDLDSTMNRDFIGVGHYDRNNVLLTNYKVEKDHLRRDDQAKVLGTQALPETYFIFLNQDSSYGTIMTSSERIYRILDVKNNKQSVDFPVPFADGLKPFNRFVKLTGTYLYIVNPESDKDNVYISKCSDLATVEQLKPFSLKVRDVRRFGPYSFAVEGSKLLYEHDGKFQLVDTQTGHVEFTLAPEATKSIPDATTCMSLNESWILVHDSVNLKMFRRLARNSTPYQAELISVLQPSSRFRWAKPIDASRVAIFTYDQSFVLLDLARSFHRNIEAVFLNQSTKLAIPVTCDADGLWTEASTLLKRPLLELRCYHAYHALDNNIQILFIGPYNCGLTPRNGMSHLFAKALACEFLPVAGPYTAPAAIAAQPRSQEGLFFKRVKRQEEWHFDSLSPDELRRVVV